ncbi:GTP-binding protein [Butyrivibrio sp. VCB2006]|uniref:GTP-binding protein n=1 Tax=Butyrivibrio sp. VCB2006 TaxID=1280679 RepID=UPI000408BAB6|nr:GTP-binding protein [Butyrivibrio sp. VCB2006]
MIKLDLITGFLGAGKTTFIKHYVKYLLKQGEKICIIENDFGAINVDMVLLKELESEGVNLEMVVGGDGKEAHKRRLKTKLISMAMMGCERVIIEPSGIFDVDEFFDLVYEEPLDRFYEVANVIAIVDPKLKKPLSKQARYVLMSEVADAGAIVLSRTQEAKQKEIADVINTIENAMEEFKCRQKIDENRVISSAWSDEDISWLDNVVKCGFNRNSFEKQPIDANQDFQTIFYFDFQMEKDILFEKIKNIYADSECGNIHRIKGIVKGSDGATFEINTTRNEILTNRVNTEKAVLIIIGEKLNKESISKYLGKPTL